MERKLHVDPDLEMATRAEVKITDDDFSETGERKSFNLRGLKKIIDHMYEIYPGTTPVLVSAFNKKDPTKGLIHLHITGYGMGTNQDTDQINISLAVSNDEHKFKTILCAMEGELPTSFEGLVKKIFGGGEDAEGTAQRSTPEGP